MLFSEAHCQKTDVHFYGNDITGGGVIVSSWQDCGKSNDCSMYNNSLERQIHDILTQQKNEALAIT